jgi:hypothetical protein
MRKLLIILVVGLSWFAMGSTVKAVDGSQFRPGRIIDDSVFTDTTPMNAAQIQQFLNAKVPFCETNHVSYSPANQGPFTCLKDYVENTADGTSNFGKPPGTVIPGGRSAAQIMYDASQQYAINPQVLIVLLQKESSLVTDTWPWRGQYQTAMGALCPDTAPCDSNAAGFGRQIKEAARLLRAYITYPNYFPYATGMNNILYNPNFSCGSTPVNLETRATAALYNYTPYQPNQAALDNLYGSGNACSAYGNRNFWRIFNDWFGSPYGAYTLIKSPTSPTVYLRTVNATMPISSIDVFNAWGFSAAAIETVSQSTLDGTTITPYALGRLVKTSGGDYYFIDGQKHYYVSAQTKTLWNFSDQNVPSMSPLVIQQTVGGGSLGWKVSATTGLTTNKYLVDNGKLVPIPMPTQSAITWNSLPFGETNISAPLFQSIPKTAGLADTIFVKSGAKTYVLDNQKLKPLNENQAMLPSSTPPVDLSQSLVDLIGVDPAVGLVAKSGAGELYLIDSLGKHYLTSTYLASLFSDLATIRTLSDATLLAIPTVDQISNDVAEEILANGLSAGKYLFTIQGKYTLSDPILLDEYNGARVVPKISYYPASVKSILPEPVSGLVRLGSSPTIYLMDGGSARAITSYATYQSINETRNEPVTILDQGALQSRLSASVFYLPVVSGGVQYHIDSGAKYVLPPSLQQRLQTPPPSSISPMTLQKFAGNDTLKEKFNINGDIVRPVDGTYYIGAAYVQNLWNENPTQITSLSAQLFSVYPRQKIEVKRFVKSSTNLNDPTLYTLVEGSLEKVTKSQLAQALGMTLPEISYISTSAITNLLGASTTPYVSPVFKTLANDYYVLDEGKLWTIPAPNAADWSDSQTPTRSLVFKSVFANQPNDSGQIKRLLRGPDQKLYVLQGGKRRYISSIASYNLNYLNEPYTTVSSNFIDSLTAGPDI